MDEQNEIVLEALIRRARAIAAEIKELQETKTQIETRIDSLVEVGWKMTVDDVQATKRVGNRSFDLKTALALLPHDVKLECVSTTIDAKKVREAAETAGILEDCMVVPEGKSRVVLS